MPASDMGLPPTTPCRTLKLLDEVSKEEGYDNDGQLGPFLWKGREQLLHGWAAS